MIGCSLRYAIIQGSNRIVTLNRVRIVKNLFCLKDVELTKYPKGTHVLACEAPQVLVIGDLHSNPLKLIYTLIERGILNTETVDYDRLVTLYQQIAQLHEQIDLELNHDNSLGGHLSQFQAALRTLKVNSCYVDTFKVVLLGDELADRGANDYLVLLLLNTLREGGINYEILLSNHGAEALFAFEFMKFGDAFEAEFLAIPKQYQSLLNLNVLINRGLINKEDLYQIYHLSYRPFLRIMTTFTHLKDSKQTMICSHAPIDLNIISKLGQVLVGESFSLLPTNTDPSELSSSEIRKLIESINLEFLNRLECGELNSIFEKRKSHSDTGYFLNTLIWNRDLRILKTDLIDGDVFVDGRRDLVFIHGHMNAESNWPHNLISLNGYFHSIDRRFS